MTTKQTADEKPKKPSSHARRVTAARSTRAKHRPVTSETARTTATKAVAVPAAEPKQEPAAQPSASPRSQPVPTGSPLLRRVIFTLAIVVIVVFGAAGIFAIGLYKLGWQGAWVDRVVAVVPFPVALANGTVITYRDYQTDLKALRRYFENAPSGEAQQPEPPGAAEMSATVLNRLIYDSVVDRLAQKYQVRITPAELEEQMKTIADSRGSRDEIAKLLNTLYGWDEQQFKDKVLRPYLALQKLDDILSKDGTLAGDAEQRAGEVLNKLNAKEQTFDELAKTYSEDGTASVGGDLGFFGRGVMDADFEAALDALKPGEVSGLVRTQFGYHIIELLERLDDADKGVQYHARHILIATKSVDDYVNDRVAEQRVRLFLSGFTWDDKNHWVVPKGIQQEAQS